jgi:hypothetical protein
MENRGFDARVTARMKDVIVQLEENNLDQAEENVRILAQEVRIAADEPIRERKLANLRRRLHSGLGHIQRVAPITALARFRATLTSWLTATGWTPDRETELLISEFKEAKETFSLLSMAIQETDSLTAQQLLKNARTAYEAARQAVLERVPEIDD